MKTKIVVIVGPTSVGKSDFAVKYALENNGEIISADSRQVYKGLDIGTGKITVEEMKGVPHHLLSIVGPNEIFNVDKFCVYAKKAIEDIANRGRLPIVCGGTGFYIDSLVNNSVYPDVKHDTELRYGLINRTTKELIEILTQLDHEYVIGLNNSERHNKQRLIRSIEIATELGKVPKIEKSDTEYEVKWIGLQISFPELKKRIHARLVKRIDEGMLEEAEKLHINGLSYKRMEELGLEYRYLSRYLQYSITKDEMLEQLESEICKYAKRQMVWFKRNKQIEWISVT